MRDAPAEGFDYQGREFEGSQEEIEAEVKRYTVEGWRLIEEDRSLSSRGWRSVLRFRRSKDISTGTNEKLSSGAFAAEPMENPLR